MHQTKLSLLQEYLQRLIKQYQVMQTQTRKDAYRIVGKEIGTDGECHLIVQVIGKAITLKAKPQELAADDRMLEGFSRKDVRVITYYACTELKQSKRKIIVLRFCNNLNKMIFGIKKRGTEDIEQKTANEISLDKALLSELSQEDAHMVGFTTASEQVLRDKAVIDKLAKGE